jgi:hypothetical protein
MKPIVYSFFDSIDVEDLNIFFRLIWTNFLISMFGYKDYELFIITMLLKKWHLTPKQTNKQKKDRILNLRIDIWVK